MTDPKTGNVSKGQLGGYNLGPKASGEVVEVEVESDGRTVDAIYGTLESATGALETVLLWGTPANPYADEIIDATETAVVGMSLAAVTGALAVGVLGVLGLSVWFDVGR
jgi:hypothetical protein